MNTDAALLDEIKEKFNLKNDAQLAGLLGVTRTSIHVIRHKNGRLGIKSRLKILDKIGFRNLSNWVEKLTPKSLANSIKQLNQDQTERIIAKHESIPNREQAEFIDLMKYLFKCETDIDLAKKINLSPTTISIYRTGKTSLGEKPLLFVLQELENIDVEEVNELLDNSEVLINALKKSKIT